MDNGGPFLVHTYHKYYNDVIGLVLNIYIYHNIESLDYVYELTKAIFRPFFLIPLCWLNHFETVLVDKSQIQLNKTKINFNL